METETLTTKVTKIGSWYHVRLLDKNKVVDEMACRLKVDIRFCCNHLLRWYSKLGGYSKMAEAARNRACVVPVGKIKYSTEFQYGKENTRSTETKHH